VTASIHRVLDYVPGKPKDEFFTLETTSTSSLPGIAAATGASLEIADGQGWSVYRAES
jgi:hypothetical protein